MSDIIFRFTNNGDTIGGLGPTEKIEFNFSAIDPDDTGRHTVTGFHSTRDTNIHPNPRRTLDQIQDSLLGYIDVRVSGYFTGHAVTLGPRNLWNWLISPAQTPNFVVGRFGLQIDSFANGLVSLTPDNSPNTFGYILYDVDVQDIEDPRDEVPFIAKLYRSGVISETP